MTGYGVAGTWKEGDRDEAALYGQLPAISDL